MRITVFLVVLLIIMSATQATAQLNPEVKWKADTFTRPFFGGKVVVDEKAVYIHSNVISFSDETVLNLLSLFALTRENGKLKWKLEVSEKATTQKTPSSDLVSAGDFVYFQAGDILYALEPETGTERWKFEAPQERKLENAYFKVVERSIYFQSRTGMLYALSGDTGQLKWQLDMMGNLPLVPETPLVISDGVIYINKYDPLRKLSFSALKAETGEVLWSAEQYLSADANVIIAHSTIYVSSVDGVFALDTETGKLKWQSNRFETHGIALKGSLLYTAAPFNGDLYAFDVATGEVRWKTHVHPAVELFTEYMPSRKPLIVVANSVLLYRTSENLYALSAETGEIQWEFGAQGIRAHTVEDSVVYLLLDDSFYALNLDTGKSRWQFTDIRSLQDYDVAEDGTVYISAARGVFALNHKE
jgi:outer membrane protein assembly factor BamB